MKGDDAVSVSAPGKLMLFGEHAVVYNRPCIVTAVDQRFRVKVELTDGNNFELEAPDVGLSGYRKAMQDVAIGGVAKEARFVEWAVKNFTEKYTLKKSIKVSTKSDFSSAYGFGSSSASTVCVLKALSKLTGKKLDNRQLFKLAYKTVLDVQGKGSGFDVAAAIYGGTLYFTTAGKIIEPLDIQPPPLVVGYSGVKADTAAILSDTARKMEAQPERVNRLYDAIVKIVDEARQRMLEGDWKRVGKLMEFNQEYLRDLGVSTGKLEAMISAAKSNGAWGAKLSGAGGGDCMISVVPQEQKGAVEKAIADIGGQVIHIRTHSGGVRVESDDQDELFVVVDEKDNVREYRTRGECHHNKDLIHRAVELFIFDSLGRVLLQKRSHTKDIRAGFWSTSVGGHVGKGESYEDAMKREVREELGIDIPVTYHSKRVVEFPNEREMEALFTARYDGPFTPNTKEVDEVRFFNPRELKFGYADKSLHLTEAAINNLKALNIL